MENHLIFQNGKPSISIGHLYHGYVSHNQRVSSHLIQLIQGPDSMSWHRSSSEGIAWPSQGIAARASVVSIKTHSLPKKTGFIMIYLGISFSKNIASLMGQLMDCETRSFKMCPSPNMGEATRNIDHRTVLLFEAYNEGSFGSTGSTISDLFNLLWLHPRTYLRLGTTGAARTYWGSVNRTVGKTNAFFMAQQMHWMN